MNIEIGRAEDFSALMDHLLRCFQTHTPDHARFEVFFPDLYRPDAESMGQQRIIRENGRIIAALSLVPVELQLGPVRLRVAGIGGVSTAPELRGRGLMSTLLQAARDEIVRDGYGLSWLSGLRDRYARYGWEKAGTDVRFPMPAVAAPADADAWRTERLDPASGSLAALAAARAHKVYRGLGDEVTLRRKYQRLSEEVWEARHGRRYAYLLLNRRFKGLAEWGGDPEGVRLLLARQVAEPAEWTVRLPPEPEDYAGVFSPPASPEPKGCENLAVIHLPALLRAYEPCWAPRWPRGRSLQLRMKPFLGFGSEASIADGHVADRSAAGATQVDLDALVMASLLFGPKRPSELLPAAEAHWLDAVFPLPFFMPFLWGV